MTCNFLPHLGQIKGNGLSFTFVKYRDYDLVIHAAAGDIINDGTAGKKFKNNESEAYKASVTLLAVDNTYWIPIAIHGTWINDND